MIEKMKFVSIMGPIEDMDRVEEAYLRNCDIQVEDAVREIGQASGVSNFSVVNRHADYLRKAEQFANLLGLDGSGESSMSEDAAKGVIDEAEALLQDISSKISELTLEKSNYEDMRKEVAPFIDLEFPMERLVDFHFIKYRFGRIPVNSFKQFEAYLHDTEGILFEKSGMDKNFVYCVYFVPEPLYEKTDAIFSSLHFEAIDLSKELTGTPHKAYMELEKKIEVCDEDIRDLEAERNKRLLERSNDLTLALLKLRELSGYADMQKYAAKTKDDFYIVVGWMPEREARKLEKDTENDDKVVVLLEEDSTEIKSKPPTKLKNPFFIRPFENLIRMYGLPKYGEIDPTGFFALSYSLLFGLMFGDLGQGLTLSLIGWALSTFFKVALGSVLIIVGISSAFFGLMYGSVFGYEGLIPTLWVSPMHNVETVLITSLCFGIILNIIAMVFHIVNGVKSKELEAVFFDSSGIAGITFYIAALAAVLSAYTGYFKISAGIGFIFLGIPLLLIMFREPLANYFEKRERLIEGKISDFWMGAFFETFEILLSYVTNTASFVRVGAFALCHAGMMSVVLMLAGAGENSLGNPLIMVLGNIFVMCLEGLIVGIQALRLQFYEMFSRYFKGGGREFKSFKNSYKH